MTYFVFIAILNGIVIGTSRSVNGKLSFYVGPLKASLWNHVMDLFSEYPNLLY